MGKEKWVYSTDEEYFNCEEEYDTKELAIEAVKKDAEIEDNTTVWIGRAVEINKDYLIKYGIASVDADNMVEALGNEVGEIADDWFSIVNEHTDKMSEMIADYIIEHCPPTFGAIEDIFEITK